MAGPGAPSYRQLLEEARELGRADGAFAAAFEPSDSTGPDGRRCLGRTPAEFARLLCEDRSAVPPTGLELNAPLWYAAGFAEALDRARRRAAERVVVRWVFT